MKTLFSFLIDAVCSSKEQRESDKLYCFLQRGLGVGCSECGMLRMLGMWNVLDVESQAYGMLGIWNVWDMGIQSVGCGMFVYKIPYVL